MCVGNVQGGRDTSRLNGLFLFWGAGRTPASVKQDASPAKPVGATGRPSSEVWGLLEMEIASEKRPPAIGWAYYASASAWRVALQGRT